MPLNITFPLEYVCMPRLDAATATLFLKESSLWDYNPGWEFWLALTITTLAGAAIVFGHVRAQRIAWGPRGPPLDAVHHPENFRRLADGRIVDLREVALPEGETDNTLFLWKMGIKKEFQKTPLASHDEDGYL